LKSRPLALLTVIDTNQEECWKLTRIFKFFMLLLAYVDVILTLRQISVIH